MRTLCFISISLLLAISALAQAPATAPAPTESASKTLQLTGDFPTPRTFTAADLGALPRNTLQQQNKAGLVTYEGVFLRDILTKAGIKFSHGLTGKTMASYLLLTAADGYQVVLTLPEVDPDFANETILVADRRSDEPLTTAEQPFQLVVPSDKLRARSMHSLTTIQLIRLRK